RDRAPPLLQQFGMGNVDDGSDATKSSHVPPSGLQSSGTTALFRRRRRKSLKRVHNRRCRSAARRENGLHLSLSAVYRPGSKERRKRPGNGGLEGHAS